MLPPGLQRAIEERCAAVPGRVLARAAALLSEDYRARGTEGAVSVPDRCAAYLATRMPATFAAIRAAMEEARARVPGLDPRSLLDVACGPGTASWAALDVFPGIESVDGLDQSDAMLAEARLLAAQSGAAALREARLARADLASVPRLAASDLVACAYALNELPAALRERVVPSLWNTARMALVLVETGTPAGFACLLEAREALVALGARIAAPCPGEARCPMAGTTSWCHFARRLARSRLHRTAKEAALGFEDEKFSYLVVARLAAAPAERIVSAPRTSKAEVVLDVCGPEGRREERVARRSGDAYRAARKLAWGDALGPSGG